MIRSSYLHISGLKREFKLEHQIFNTLCFIAGLFTLIGFALNIWLDLGWEILLVSILGAGNNMVHYYLARVKGIFNVWIIEIYAVISVLLLGAMYFGNAGSAGTIPLFLLVSILPFILISEKRQILRIGMYFGITLSVLIVLEILHPQWVKSYQSNIQRMLDLATSVFYSLIFLGVILRLFKYGYDNDKKLITRQKNEMQQLYRREEEKNQQIEILMRELHHRVKNNMQLVSGLLSMQANRIDDETARLAIDAGRTRIDAMGLIHQKLFMDGDPTSVDIQEYLEDLSLSLMAGFGFKKENIDVSIELPSAIMNVDTAMPLGLIVNELVTNSCKHAFAETDLPKVSIKLFSEGEEMTLTVADNGKGFSEVLPASNSFGLKLVRTLVKQLDGTLDIRRMEGMEYTVCFKGAW